MEISQNAQQIIESRYIWKSKGEQTWEDVARRVGSTVFRDDSEDLVEMAAHTIWEGLFLPGGRILRNAGRPRGSLFNCYCVPFGDSIEEIAYGTSACMQLWKDGGGTGVTFSPLRPKGADLKSSEGFSSGPMPFLYGLNEMGKAIQTGGQRRAAGLALLDVSHPDIAEFIAYKDQDGQLSHFNISVGITEDFIDAVRHDREWPLTWRHKVWKTVSAVELWNDIIERLSKNGEPGIINLDNLRTNNSYYFAPIIGTNPCGETCLEPWGVCNLGSIVLKHFVTVNGRIKWKELKDVVRFAVRFLDTCIDINKYTLGEIKQTAQRGRRIGLGVMGLGDMLLAIGARYGSEQSLAICEELFKFIRNESYVASIELAREKGAFPAFDPISYGKSKFVRTLPIRIRNLIREHGIRNVTLMAMAPTGTISLVPETTSGIEPLPFKAYKRADNVSDRVYVHPMVSDFVRDNNSRLPDYFVDTTDLNPIDHLETQAVIQRYVDGAVSKTINIPKDFKDEKLSNLLLESISDLKGVTVYRDSSREGQPLQALSRKEILAACRKEEFKETQDVEALTCARGTCEV